MTQRTMQISVIGCLNNCIREYNEKLHKLRQLLDNTSVQDEIEDEIKDYLGGSDAENMSVGEVLDEFFDQEHGMIKIGTMLAGDLQKALWGDFSKMEILQAKTDDEKAALKQIVDALH